MTEKQAQPLTDGGRVRVDEQNPWPGLASFTEQDSAFFNGRETETDQLFALTSRSRLTTLFGVSGLGKTSLLLAGVFPRLREQAVLPVLIRLDYSEDEPDLVRQIFQAIHREAESCGAEAPPAQDGNTLWEYFHREDADFWSDRNKLLQPLLVFDQFEEIFTLGLATPGRRRATERFVEALADLVEGRAPESVRRRLDAGDEDISEYNFRRHEYKVLLSLREDFLAPLEGLRKQMPAIVHNRYRLRRMSGEAAMTVVGAAEHLVTPEVAERIVRFVAAQDDGSTALEDLVVEPALLSVVSREFNNRRRRANEDRITDHLIAGTAEEILDDVYDNGVDDFGDRTADVRAFIEDHLLTESGFRDSEALDNALTLPGIDHDVITKLVNQRLLRYEDRDGVRRVELTHDLLTGVIRKSREHRRELQREAAAEAEREKLAAERAAFTRKLRNAVIGIAACIALLILSFVLWSQAEVARDEAETWRDASRESLARTKLQLDEPDVAGLLLARVENASSNAAGIMRQVLERGLVYRLEGPDKDITFEQGTLTPNRRHALAISRTRRAYYWTLPQRHPTRDGEAVAMSPLETAPMAQLPSGDGGILAFAVSADGAVGVIGTRNGKSRIYHGLTNHKELLNDPDGQPIWAAAVTPAGDRVAMGWSDRTVRLWRIKNGHTQLAPVLDFALTASGGTDPYKNANETISVVSFSPNGQRLVAASSQGRIVCWTGNAEQPPEPSILPRHNGAIIAAEFDGSSQLLATGSWDGHIRVFAFAGSEQPTKVADYDLEAPLVAITIAADGKSILAAAESGRVDRVQLGNTDEWKCSKIMAAAPDRGPPVALSYRPGTTSGEFLLAFQNGGIEIRRDSDEVTTLESHRPVRFALWSQDGSRVLSSSSIPASEEVPDGMAPHELRVWFPQTVAAGKSVSDLHAQLREFFANHGFARIGRTEALRLGLLQK